MQGENLKQTFRGCYVATLSPFDAADSVDYGVVRAHSSWLVENGIEGLCPAGSTGEFLYLSDEEKRGVVSATLEGADGRVPVIAGVWALRIQEAADLARHAQQAGAQGVFLPPPIYYPANDDEIFRWYAFVGAATKLPLFAYNIPQYAANPVSVACLRRLFEHGIIAGVKDSMGKTERMTELVREFGAEHVVFAASDGFATEGRKIGADGFISAMGNAFPALLARLWDGDESLQPRVNDLRGVLKQMGSLSALKYLLGRQGFAFGDARLPLSMLTPDQRALLDTLELP